MSSDTEPTKETSHPLETSQSGSDPDPDPNSTSISHIQLRDPVAALEESVPPVLFFADYINLIRKIIKLHAPPDFLPTLYTILQDVDLTKLIGWDLVLELLPLPGAEPCLITIARLGNPREVILGVTQGLSNLKEEAALFNPPNIADPIDATDGLPGEPSVVNKFCLLLSMLSIIHPRIKTKYPSQFLETTLKVIRRGFTASDQAILAVISFVRAVSGKKRPPLPDRQSSANITTPFRGGGDHSLPGAPDPEAEEEQPDENAILRKQLQSFLLLFLGYYIFDPMDWAARLLETFDPTKVIAGRKSLGKTYKTDPASQLRDTIVGQFAALLRDLGLKDPSTLLGAIYADEDIPATPEYVPLDGPFPSSSPESIPLPAKGSLLLLAYSFFTTHYFNVRSNSPNELVIFPSHSRLLSHFLSPSTALDLALTDALLTIGLCLEHDNKFVSGLLDDSEFLSYLMCISLISSTSPSPTLRYCAHTLATSILHSHPEDRVRLSFISLALSSSAPSSSPLPENLMPTAVTWLKEEIITAEDRGSKNAFSTPTALVATMPYLFPDVSTLLEKKEKDEDEDKMLVGHLMQQFSFYMSVLNFVYFLGAEQYKHVVPEGMMVNVVQEIFLEPLREMQTRLVAAVEMGRLKDVLGGEEDAQMFRVDLELLGERIDMVSTTIHDIND